MEISDSFHSDLLEWWKQSARDFPWRSDPSPYEILIAEILLQATSAEKVEPVYKEFINRYPDAQSLSNADESNLSELLQPLGLQQRKAQWLTEIGQIIQTKEVPKNYEDLHNLPGVGKYGANAILCFGFEKQRPIVDTNVIRIYNRILTMDMRDAEDDKAWEVADSLLPRREVADYNLALLDLGSLICTSRNPKCHSCPVSKHCEYFKDVNA